MSSTYDGSEQVQMLNIKTECNATLTIPDKIFSVTPDVFMELLSYWIIQDYSKNIFHGEMTFCVLFYGILSVIYLITEKRTEKVQIKFGIISLPFTKNGNKHFSNKTHNMYHVMTLIPALLLRFNFM